MKNILLIITLFISWNAVAVEKTWFCVTEKSAGLNFKNNAWKTVTFKDKRVTVSQTDNNLKFSKNVLGFGSNKKCGLGSSGDVVYCTDFSTIFTLNPENGLATSASTFGWLFSETSPDSLTTRRPDSLITRLWKCESF
jgi:hypothetical protein